MDDDADRALVERYRNGDHEAFTDLVVRYQRPVYNAAFWVLRSVEDAQDVAQIVFMRIAERLDEFDGQHKFFSWIYRIAVNESLNLLCRHEEFDVADDGSGNPESQLSNAQLSRSVRSALMTLSTNDRVVLTLRHFSECSYEQIAQILDLDEKTVKSRLFEARHRLRGLLAGLHQH